MNVAYPCWGQIALSGIFLFCSGSAGVALESSVGASSVKIAAARSQMSAAARSEDAAISDPASRAVLAAFLTANATDVITTVARVLLLETCIFLSVPTEVVSLFRFHSRLVSTLTALGRPDHHCARTCLSIYPTFVH